MNLLLGLLGGGLVGLAVLDGSATSRGTSSVGRGRGEADVLLRLNANNERGNVDHLLSDGDVSLADEDTSVVDGLGHSALEDLSLETALKEILIGQRQDEIQLVLVLREDTDALETTEKGSSLEDTTGIVGIQGQEGTGSLASLGEGKMDTPQLRLVLQSELSDEAELVIETLLLVGTTRSVGGLAVLLQGRGGRHL